MKKEESLEKKNNKTLSHVLMINSWKKINGATLSLAAHHHLFRVFIPYHVSHDNIIFV